MLVRLPDSWPALPDRLSVSALLEIESCPRRWSLKNAQFPDVWDKSGYPERPSLTAVRGRVLHKSLEVTLRALAHDNCPSLQDQSAIEVLRNLGGYSKIIENSIRREVRSYIDNPRAQSVLDQIESSLEALIAELRTDLQTLLAHSGYQSGVTYQTGESRRVPSARRALGIGSHPEVDLIDSSNSWKGIADLILLSDTNCEIRDYKSGKPKDTDQFQLQVYAWLWSQDRVRNPTGRLSDRLVLVYPFGIQEVDTPKEDQLQQLEQQLKNRTAAAVSDIADNPPPARPSEETCKFCHVRQLCQAYWDALPNFADAGSRSQFADLEVSVEKRRGPTTWDARIDLSSVGLRTGKCVISDPRGVLTIQEASTVRLLAVHYSEPTPDDLDPDTPVVTVGRHSEAFVIPSEINDS